MNISLEEFIEKYTTINGKPIVMTDSMRNQLKLMEKMDKIRGNNIVILRGRRGVTYLVC